MKRIIFLLVLPVVALAQPKAGGFEIRGTIKGLKDNDQIILKSGNNGQNIATANAKGESFVLKGVMSSPDIVQLGIAGNPGAADFFIFNDTLAVNGDIQSLAELKITGSVLEAEYASFKQLFNPYKEKLNNLAKTINAEKDQNKKNEWIGKFNEGKIEVLKAGIGFIKEKPASAVSPFVLYVISPLMEGGLPEIESVYAMMTGAAKTGPYAAAIEKAIAESKLGSVGSAAIDFTQNDTNGKPVKLSSFKGKYVLVDFWASWCGPCRQENPNVVAAYNRYKDKNFTVLGISLDQEKERWLQAIKADHLSWTHLSDLKYWNNAVAQLYHIQSIPANMLIDPNGKIIGKNLRGTELQETLKALFVK